VKERDRLEDLGIDGRVMLKRVIEVWDVEAWTGLLWLKIGTSGGRLEWNVVMKLRDP
jgi:hypothetical protein